MTKVIEFKEYVVQTGPSVYSVCSVDSQLNDFLNNHKVTVIDIKYQVICNKYSEPRSRALLIYEEE